MCRLFAYVGNPTEKETVFFLNKFQRMSRTGHVPKIKNIKQGHTEGWGMVAYSNETIVYEKKRKGTAHTDAEFKPSTINLSKRSPHVIIAHLRKITNGTVTSRNNHPFVHGKYSFSHNGSVDDTEKIPLEGYFRDGVRGNTDTERMFAYLLQTIYRNNRVVTSEILKKSLKTLLVYIRKNHEYTCVNCQLSDGRYLWVVRDFNPSNPLVKQHALENYFSLYYGIGTNSFAVCSEKMDIPGIKWHLIKNRQCIQYDSKTKQMKIVDWS